MVRGWAGRGSSRGGEPVGPGRAAPDELGRSGGGPGSPGRPPRGPGGARRRRSQWPCAWELAWAPGREGWRETREEHRRKEGTTPFAQESPRIGPAVALRHEERATSALREDRAASANSVRNARTLYSQLFAAHFARGLSFGLLACVVRAQLSHRAWVRCSGTGLREGIRRRHVESRAPGTHRRCPG